MCHSLQLAASKAVETLPRNIDFLVHHTYSWFSFSSARQAAYKEIYTTINNGIAPLKIMAPSGTRWLSIFSCVDRILSQWDELELHFQMAKSKDKCYTAVLLHQMYSDPAVKLYLQFLKPVLGDFNRLNKLFQGEAVSCLKLFSDLELFYRTLVQRTVNPSVVKHVKNLQELDLKHDSVFLSPMEADLGAFFSMQLQQATLDQAAKNLIRERCTEFLREALRQVAMRLPDNLKMLGGMTSLSPKTATCAVKPKITEMPFIDSHFKGDLSRLDSEWRQVTVNYKCLSGN